MEDRKLATIREIAEIKPIEGADFIEAARVDGWWCVVKKGDFKIRDTVVYCEIDSWIPHDIAPFLTKSGKKPKEYNGVKGQRLKTVKLRGQISQGLLLPLQGADYAVGLGEDLTETMGIQKWEKPIPAQLRGVSRGSFPHFIRKTDQERIQNIPEVLEDHDTKYEITLKMDGSSMTVYVHDGEVGVCSRNINLKLKNKENIFVKTAFESKLVENLLCYYEVTGKSIAVQGELMGPGIQGNREALDKVSMFMFDVWDIDNQKYMDPFERAAVYDFIADFPVPHVRRYNGHYGFTSLSDLEIRTIEEMLDFPSKIEKCFQTKLPIEGLVFKACDGSRSFKVINNEYLLKND